MRSLVAMMALAAGAGPCSAAMHPAEPASPPIRWTPPGIGTERYETTPTFSADGRSLHFMRADRGFDSFRLLASECRGGRWTPPREPAFSAPDGMHDGDPFLSPDGSTLYFISTRHRFHEAGNEDFDIFAVDRGADGHWGAPRRLPEPVNSEGSELLPSIDRNGVLYFGSSRPGGHGGSDIYRAVRDADGTWQVANVAGVNTAANEYEADVSVDGRRLAVVSDRDVRSRIHLYRRVGDGWTFEHRIQAHDAVFQVGPRFSPDGRRLLFGQDDGADSGEIFVVDLDAGADRRWPPRCGG